MTTIRAGDREFHTLPTGHVLTATAAAASAGLVRQYPASGFDAVSATAIGAGGTATIGPFTGSVRLGVECSAGTVTWAAGEPDASRDLAAAEVGGLQALVSKEGNYCLGANVDYLVANNTLTDADGVLTQKQMAVITVPGGLFGPKSVLEVNLVGLTSGANGKNFGFKAGPASGTMSSATAFGGGGGLTTHAALGFRAMLWGNGVAGAQRATPVGMQNWTGTNANAFITLAIDTSLDWNIYVFCQFTSTAAGDSAMLRTFWANWQN